MPERSPIQPEDFRDEPLVESIVEVLVQQGYVIRRPRGDGQEGLIRKHQARIASHPASYPTTTEEDRDGGRRQKRQARSGSQEHPSREAILRHLRVFSGCNLREICSTLGLNRGTATHHLRVLERMGAVESVRVGRERRFFVRRIRLPDGGEDVLSEPLAENIALTVAQRPGLTRRAIKNRCNTTEDELTHSLEMLVQLGWIEERRTYGQRTYHPTDALDAV